MTTAGSCKNYKMLGEAELIECVRGGDQGAASELFRRYWGFAYRCSSSVSRGFQDIDAEDLAQESLFRAFINIASYEPGLGQFAAWLYGIIRHTLVNMIRAKQSRRRSSKGGAPETVPEVQLPSEKDLENIADGTDWKKIEETAWLLSRMASGSPEQPEANARRTLLELIGEAVESLPGLKRDLLLIKFLYHPDDIPSDELDELEAAFGMTRDSIRQTNYRTVKWVKQYVLCRYEPGRHNTPADTIPSDQPKDESE